MRKLAAPLRVTWDWDWPPVAHPGAPPRRPPPELVREVAEEVVGARVLLLEVGYPDSDALTGGELARALAGFTGELSLVLGPVAAAVLAEARPWEGLRAAEVWLDATPMRGATVPIPAWPAVRIYLTAGNTKAAAAALIDAVGRGATRVSLPNLPLFGELLGVARDAAPASAHLREFSDLVLPVLLSHPGVDLRVHHYGLWEIFHARGFHSHGGEAPGQAGCQAGTALAYIDPRGILYPCASLPIPLARMEQGAISRAWAGQEAQTIRDDVAHMPTACRGCPAEITCRGGCRGWAHYLAGAWDAVGPDCMR